MKHLAFGRGGQRVRGLLILVAALLVLMAGCDWPMFGFGPDGTRSSPDTSISRDAVAGSMVLDWTGLTNNVVATSPAVANGRVYVGSGTGMNLYAFDAAGTTNCSGIPKTCAPLWTAGTGGFVFSSPAVANGVVYVGSFDGRLYAFDAASGAFLWYGQTNHYVEFQSPVVANGVVYLGSDDGNLYAFDAAGTTNCSGTPKTCTPLWSAPTGGLPGTTAVSGGVVYVDANGYLHAFDAAGNTNCSGSPKTCAPLWTALAGASWSPAVANGVVYVNTGDGNLTAYDAAGITNCSGTPKTCTPLWTAADGGGSNPAVAKGVVYMSAGRNDDTLYAFDAAGITNCSGTPKTCTPLWTATTGGTVLSPVIANGVVYTSSTDGHVYGFDAAGNANCAGTPKTCTPLWAATTGGGADSSPTVANGMVYVGSSDHNLYAFGLEKIPPTTSIVQPANGATLSATATLAASASDDVSVSKVEYHVTGGSYNDTLIGTATPYVCCGWVYNWNTTTVPNGTYTLNSVAYDPAGNVGHSANVTITVHN